ncbi:hypothetical protein DTO212C5_1648 [Paecilomyces variotii]|nr:hypothetical protein DTO212C5_1648 [Paecilomyces variotii]
MAASQLDQMVKGAPAPQAKSPVKEPPTPLPRSYLEGPSQPQPLAPDPLSTLPSSPPQIYLNLLILENSLRAQYLALRERRRQNTFFLLILGIWIAYFFYALFFRPREDGRGVGGSVYWVVEMGEKVALMGGVVTGILIWGTGQWERGVRWPRRWLAVANRGLRSINTKIVIIRGPWWKELLSYFSFLFPYTSFFPSPASYHYVEQHPSEKRRQHHSYDSEHEAGLVEEDVAPGGDYIKLLLLPKSFSPEFRENWDEYRTDYWEKENERRAQLRQKVRERERQIAKQEHGWLWWLPIWKSSKRRKVAAATLKSSDHHHHHHHVHRTSTASLKPSRRSTRSDSNSRTPSRSTTPVDGDDRPPSRSSITHSRRGSATPSFTETETGPQRRKKKTSSGVKGLSPLTQAQRRESSPSAASISSRSSDDS